MKAFKLITTNNNHSAFQEGSVPEMVTIGASYFFCQSHVDDSERSLHRAPRMQFVVTLKGRLKFTVSNGSSFVIEPGILLIADDIKGEGHSWELMGEENWERIYIVPGPGADDHFRIADPEA